jgi:hypothetical protein
VPKNIPLPPEVTNEDSLWPACCPKGLGPRRFWNGLRGSTRWHLNVTGFGHCDVLSDPWALTNKIAHFCSSGRDWHPPGQPWKKILDLSHFRRLVAGLVAAFVDATVNEVCEGLSWIENRDSISTFNLLMERIYRQEDVKRYPCLSSRV